MTPCITMPGRLVRGAVALAGMALVAAACGGSGGSANSGSAPMPTKAHASTKAPANTKPAALVSTRNASGGGKVLVNSAGRTLYSAEQEKSGKISCTGACTSFWLPLIAPKASVSTPSGLSGTLGTVKRPDSGKFQLTYNGSPLYTFKLDGKPGDMKGNGFHDTFGGKSFSWKAAGSVVSPSSSAPKKGGNNGGYGGGNY